MHYRTILVRLTMTCLIGTCGSQHSSVRRPRETTMAPSPPATNRPADPLPLELAFSRRSFALHEKSATSPTGKYVAYAVVTPTKRRKDLWTLASGLPVVFLGARLHVARRRYRQVDRPGGRGGDELRARPGRRTARSSPTTPTKGDPSAPGSSTPARARRHRRRT